MRSGYYYMVMTFVYLSVSTQTLIPSAYLLLYPLRGASRVTHMQIKYPHGHGPWLTRAGSVQPQPWLVSGTPRSIHLIPFHSSDSPHIHLCCVSGQFTSGPLARPCLSIYKQVSKQAYFLQARAHSLLQALNKHIKTHQAYQALMNCLKHEGGRCGHRTRVVPCAYCWRYLP